MNRKRKQKRKPVYLVWVGGQSPKIPRLTAIRRPSYDRLTVLLDSLTVLLVIGLVYLESLILPRPAFTW